MSHNIISLLVVTLMLVQTGKSEGDSLKPRHWELSGNFFFSTSSQTARPGYFETENRTDTWALQPGFAYVTNDRIQIEMDFQFAQTLNHVHFVDFIEGTTYSYSDYSGTIGFSLGPGYNLSITDRIWSFVTLKLGLSWIHNGIDFRASQSYWSEPGYVFPIIQGGFKFFIAEGGAIIVQVQYERQTRNDRIAFTTGVGYAVYP